MKLSTPIAILVLLVAGTATGTADPLPLFGSDEVLKIELRGPISTVYANRRNPERPWFPASWSYEDRGRTVALDIGIRTRGHHRLEHCDHPPLQLNFRRRQVEGTLFAGQNKLKLVSPCERGRDFERMLIQEYLIYRAYQTLTPMSFRTRLIELTFVDTEREDRSWTRWNFVIEDIDDLARRVDATVEIRSNLRSAELEPAGTAVVELFQFMIGNTDFSTLRGARGDECCHNTRPVRVRPGDEGLVPVPYDFDHAGLIDAPYALPPERVPIRNVRTRYFLGRCKPVEHWYAAVSLFRGRQDRILTLFADANLLSPSARTRSIRYLERFFDILDDPDKIEREIVDNCRGPRRD